jgi:hypothetical protein
LQHFATSAPTPLAPDIVTALAAHIPAILGRWSDLCDKHIPIHALLLIYVSLLSIASWSHTQRPSWSREAIELIF